jgi:hypothetical protein
MPNRTLTVVCLPEGTPSDRLAAAAAIRITVRSRTVLGPAGHFTAATRLRRRQLVQPAGHTAAGGPIRLLDLDAMRAAGRRAWHYRWTLWQRVVAGTTPAQPYWRFLDRHRAAPARYPLAEAQRHYLAQARIAAMLTYNALPNRIMELPAGHVEAFQAGEHSYAHLGWLSAVPGDALLCLDGSYLTVHTDHLATRLAYLAEANRRLTALGPRDYLVALLTC